MPSELAHHWTLDPDTVFLNHGSFGATARPVLEAQSAWRARMEREPVAFFARDLEGLLDEARAELGDFVGADPEGLAFVPNATAGLNTALRALDLRPGDELLTTDHAYNAAFNVLTEVAAASGCRAVVAAVPFPDATPSAVCEAVLDAVTPHTRLALLDHVTSATALVLPIAELVARLAERGVETLVDGAHAPGMVRLELDRIGAAFTTGNGHKWLGAPKGAAFLHVRADLRDRVRPLVISHGANATRVDRSRFRLEHDWTGTNDPSAWLSIPAAIRFGETLLPGGWDAVMKRNHDLAITGRDLVCEAVGVPPPAPDEMIGSMVSVPLPGPQSGPPPAAQYGDPLHDALLREGIQVATAPWPQRWPSGAAWRRIVRFSSAPYVARDDLERLARALPAAAGVGARIG